MTNATCLGMTFSSEEQRREYFREELRKRLPELKKIEGFPIGEDEDIIALSDPPYYTACPNPWLNDFIAEWEKEKETIEGRLKDFKVDEPYASDVSEGKNNPIYNAHSYHTKVPHPAIMRYILHYTQPGDIILDGFAGTGMTGVAAQMCGKPDAELKFKIETEFRHQGLKPPVWGARKAICGDLSPIASFIAYNYNTPVDVEEFEREAKRILKEVETECGWMYETRHGNSIGRINYTVWSDVFICPGCGGEIVFWDAAVDKTAGKVLDEFPCTHCKALQSKKTLSKAKRTIFDKHVEQASSLQSGYRQDAYSTACSTITQTKTVPVLINYTYNGKRYEKTPDAFDLELIQRIEEMDIPYWFPSDRMPEGDESRRNDREGITHVHHFYTKRNLYINQAIYHAISKTGDRIQKVILFGFNNVQQRHCKMNAFRFNVSFPSNITAGTLYVPSMTKENNFFEQLKNKLSKRIKPILNKLNSLHHSIITTNSNTHFSSKDASIDYIFTDPPFGANIMYSELNFLWESWLKVKTNNKTEAIENKSQGKSLIDYQNIMTQCFKEYYRVLKPGRWMTVEFSNTSAAVWNGIQTALQRAGFVIANVSALDKQQGSFKAVTTTTAVRQDLVISCYKPTEGFEKVFSSQPVDVSLWDFVCEHLEHLPVHLKKDQKTTAIIERSPKILYDRVITFFLMRGLPVPIDAADFQAGLNERFVERDGMYFTLEQVAEYDEMKANSAEPHQLLLYEIIYSEADAVQWLKQRLKDKPQTYQDIMPDFRRSNVATRKGEKEIELNTVLEENFIQLPDGKWRVPDMNEAKDREVMRNRTLLREFDRYVEQASSLQQRGTGKMPAARKMSVARKLKEVRTEALRAGFKACWEKKDYQKIVSVGDNIPQNLLLEDEQLLMFYDIAKDRL